MLLQHLEELENELHTREPRQVYLILGPEQYQCRQALNLLKNRIATPDSYAFDYSEFTAGEVSIDEIIEAVNTFPMIAKKRLVIVGQVEKLKDAEQDALLSALGGMSKRTVLILVAGELDHRKKFYKTLRETVCVAEFPKLKEAALERWAESFVRQQGYRVSSASIRKLVELAGSDLQNLATELEKIMLYSGASKNVPDSAIDDLVRESRHHGIFELIGAIGDRDRSKALKSLSNLLSMGEPPLVIVAMMARHCRQVLIAKDCLLRGKNPREAVSAAQVPAFLTEKFLRQVRATDHDSIREVFIRLAEIDKRLKSSAADGRMLLESIICKYV